MNMKIAEMAMSAIFKKGLLYEGENLDIELDVPMETEGGPKNIKIHIKASNMMIKITNECKE